MIMMVMVRMKTMPVFNEDDEVLMRMMRFVMRMMRVCIISSRHSAPLHPLSGCAGSHSEFSGNIRI